MSSSLKIGEIFGWIQKMVEEREREGSIEKERTEQSKLEKERKRMKQRKREKRGEYRNEEWKERGRQRDGETIKVGEINKNVNSNSYKVLLSKSIDQVFERKTIYLD